MVVLLRPLFEFHYTRYVNNDPLISPSVVVAIQGNFMRLEDGRSVMFDTRPGVVNDLVSSLSNRVDLEIAENGEDVTIFVESPYAFCGNPFQAMLGIPSHVPLELDRRHTASSRRSNGLLSEVLLQRR